MASRNVATEYGAGSSGESLEPWPGMSQTIAVWSVDSVGDGRREHVGGRREPVRQQHRRPDPRDLAVDVHVLILPLRHAGRPGPAVLTDSAG